MELVTSSQMQELDRRTIEEAGLSGTTLMQRAGEGLANCLNQTFGPLGEKRVCIICGKGNNGGDGLVLARRLRQQHVRVHVLLMHDPASLSPDARVMYQQFLELAEPDSITPVPSREAMNTVIGHSDLVVDALLGTGITSNIRGRYREAIESINQSGLPVIAVDLPSGVDADTGAILGIAVRASLTVTFGCPKLGLYLGPAVDYVGRVMIVEIGIPKEYLKSLNIHTHLLAQKDVAPLVPPRPASSHKGRFGHAGIIAGSIGKTGAAALAARAALRVGTGLVTVATPSSANGTVEGHALEAMTSPMPATADGTLAETAFDPLQGFMADRQALAIGPGLSTHPETVSLIQSLLPTITQPCVVDADALNALARQPDLFQSFHENLILTPHPGEMARLLGHDTTAHMVNANRLTLARQFAQEQRVIVILKGVNTLISAPDGRTAICPTGNPGMATAGMGDALTGVLVGFLAQGLSLWDAACLGVYLHGLAGDLAARSWGLPGLIASDLIETLPHALQALVNSEIDAPQG